MFVWFAWSVRARKNGVGVVLCIIGLYEGDMEGRWGGVSQLAGYRSLGLGMRHCRSGIGWEVHLAGRTRSGSIG